MSATLLYVCRFTRVFTDRVPKCNREIRYVQYAISSESHDLVLGDRVLFPLTIIFHFLRIGILRGLAVRAKATSKAKPVATSYTNTQDDLDIMPHISHRFITTKSKHVDIERRTIVLSFCASHVVSNQKSIDILLRPDRFSGDQLGIHFPVPYSCYELYSWYPAQRDFLGPPNRRFSILPHG